MYEDNVTAAQEYDLILRLLRERLAFLDSLLCGDMWGLDHVHEDTRKALHIEYAQINAAIARRLFAGRPKLVMTWEWLNKGTVADYTAIFSDRV